MTILLPCSHSLLSLKLLIIHFELNSQTNRHSIDEEIVEKLGTDLEYYVHYEGYNRRVDRWVPHTYIIIDDEGIKEEMERRSKQEEELKTELSGFLENDEDAGMDQKHVQMHEQATKIRTIEWIQIGKYKCEAWCFSPYPEGYHYID